MGEDLVPGLLVARLDGRCVLTPHHLVGQLARLEPLQQIQQADCFP
jgi:hypothetical protein